MSCSHDHAGPMPVPDQSAALPAPDIAAETLLAYGEQVDGVRLAHAGTLRGHVWVGSPVRSREQVEEMLDAALAPGATRCRGAGRRPVPEAPDPVRTAFQRDADRVKHASCFRRLAAKTQVVMDAGSVNDHLRSRMTHSVEVAQVALGIGVPLGLNADLLEAASLAHDVGHGPAGHAAEEALSPYVDGGYDHAIYGADVLCTELNLTVEVINAVRHHSWRLPSPVTPEAHVVSWADRIAYVAHDFDDAVRAGVLRLSDLPREVARFAGTRQSEQIHAFVSDMHAATAASGLVSMGAEAAAALDEFRRFNYERIYLRPASARQSARAVTMLRTLVDHYADCPAGIPGLDRVPASGSPEAVAAAVRYVSGMTDRYAMGVAVAELGYDPAALPRPA